METHIRKRVESDLTEEEDPGEMACNGGCKGKWSRYSFEELDWNQDPLAEDGLWHAHSSISECAACLCIVYSTLITVCAPRYCAMCAMSKLVTQQLHRPSSYTRRRRIARLDLQDVCDK